MAWLKIDVQHQDMLDKLLTSSRVASLPGRASTGPFQEMRQVVMYAASLGYAAGRSQSVGQSKTQIRDTVMLGAHGAPELAFVLAFHAKNWSLDVIADGDDANEVRLRALEEAAAGGFALLTEKYEAAGGSVSATELMLMVKESVSPPKASFQPTGGEETENPLIAALRRRGKLGEQPPT